jgi:hypothetical protein
MKDRVGVIAACDTLEPTWRLNMMLDPNRSEESQSPNLDVSRRGILRSAALLGVAAATQRGDTLG